MERLTARNKKGIYYPYCDSAKGCGGYCASCEFERKIAEKLAAYEDTEEQGLLLRLPCRVGDTLYYVDDIRKFVDECKVTKLDFRTMNKYHMSISIEIQGKLWHCIGDGLIGEVAFFDKEEAEQALKRMESE